jgi:hypothetical protein
MSKNDRNIEILTLKSSLKVHKQSLFNKIFYYIKIFINIYMYEPTGLFRVLNK